MDHTDWVCSYGVLLVLVGFVSILTKRMGISIKRRMGAVSLTEQSTYDSGV